MEVKSLNLCYICILIRMCYAEVKNKEMNKIKNLLITSFMMLPATLFADGYSCIIFGLTDNTEISVVSDDLIIDYDNHALHLTSPTVDQVIPVEKVKFMKFKSDPSGIERIFGIDSAESKDYYDLSGCKVGSFTSIEEARKSLPSAIYVIKNGDKSLKVIF